ncbi:vacuolar protein sorting-associated protein vps17 [Coprinopsis cinerea okayama7|uniref:Vacuolar protein sorting-associated protein vps17 n=1 Tax=Coprinopsis cinerea (strain Okayama-7 / 130 / ATCC MYA-4618 / FGSC 9003) TaxID=240176 RepID=A8NX32_COPC7|nr:vacuolar protein sorting-associated protein vps17 [Coprinopsis cinerea okayama7\|eukprot:XP_001837053.1 vacuolar protein sorting-associated protein vps17 [Coprinopsis cinerea okayama7\
MYDPLNPSNSGFGDSITSNPFASDAPAWPSTPHTPGSPVPNLRRASPALPQTPDHGPAPGLYGKEPQIYGQPDTGLISPRETIASNGISFEKPDPYLKVRITGLDRNRRDILIKFDAQTNLSNFTGTTYRNVSRSYLEFQQFYEAIVQSNPQTIIPALPLAQTSAPTDEEDDRLVKIMLQRWFTRVCEDQILLSDEDLRSFIESDFGYQPTPRPRRKTSSGFTLIRRNVPDEDEELQRARFELTKLETQFFETAKAVDRLAITRKALAGAHAAMGDKLINVATTEAHPPLGNALRKLGRTWHSLADLDHAQSISECVILGDSLGYQGMNARSAKETLQMRTGVLEEYQAAVKTTISKRRQIERLKASSNIRPERVDDALEDMEEAEKYEQILARRAEGISQNLHTALQTHNRYANDDITTALIEHARSSILYERQLLRDLEALRVDVSNANKKVLPPTTAPRPSYIPPLEDFDRPPPVVNGKRQSRDIHAPPQTAVPPVASSSKAPAQRERSSSVPPESANGPQVPPLAATQSFAPAHPPPLAGPGSRQPLSQGAGPSGSSVTEPSTPVGPPLGGKFVDGTKSMFVTPSASTANTSPSSSSAAGPLDPLRNDSYQAPISPLHDPLTRSATAQPSASHTVDPLGQIKTRQMSSSVRIQPQRPRLDPREAASKLANMF